MPRQKLNPEIPNAWAHTPLLGSRPPRSHATNVPNFRSPVQSNYVRNTEILMRSYRNLYNAYSELMTSL